MTLSSTVWLPILAAWRTNWRDTFDGVYFESNTDEVWAIFVVTAILLAVVLVWHVVATWGKGRFTSNSPRSLFRELCRAHSLSRPRRRLLKRLAAARAVSPPALLFVQPECFALAGLPDDLASQAEEIALLEQRLFGQCDGQPGRRAASSLAAKGL